jgi:hypothetical protein
MNYTKLKMRKAKKVVDFYNLIIYSYKHSFEQLSTGYEKEKKEYFYFASKRKIIKFVIENYVII